MCFTERQEGLVWGLNQWPVSYKFAPKTFRSPLLIISVYLTWSWVLRRSMGAVTVRDTASASPAARTNVLHTPKPDASSGNSRGIARLSPTSKTYRQTKNYIYLSSDTVGQSLSMRATLLHQLLLPAGVSTRSPAPRCCPQGWGWHGAGTRPSPQSWSCPYPSWQQQTQQTQQILSVFVSSQNNSLSTNFVN